MFAGLRLEYLTLDLVDGFSSDDCLLAPHERTVDYVFVGEAAGRMEDAGQLVGVAFVEAVEVALHRRLDGTNVLVHGTPPQWRRARLVS